VAHLYVVQCEHRDALRRYLAACGIATDVHYPVPDHRQPALAAADSATLPVTDRASARVLSLPCFPELGDDEVERVIAACNAFRP
jgi:dTDP-4-amino-4,6-dideoxygalactose transaminase